MDKCLFLSVLLCSQTLWASIDNSTTRWQCMAHDKQKKTWTAEGDYELLARNKSFEACKKQSEQPSSCKVTNESCEVFVRGESHYPLWRCTALDQMAKAWVSKTYRQRDEAAIAAREYCKANSAMPDSCYINLFTCRNLSERR